MSATVKWEERRGHAPSLRNGGRRPARPRAAARTFSGVLAWVLAGAGGVVLNLGVGGQPAGAAASAAPELVKILGYVDRIDDHIDEMRADFILRVPRGCVDPITGELKEVAGKKLRIGYDGRLSGNFSLQYANTMSSDGANAWATATDGSTPSNNHMFTIHKVIPSGDSEFLAVSAVGDLNVPNSRSENDVAGGRLEKINWYFGFSSLEPFTRTDWIASSVAKPLDYSLYYGHVTGSVKTGPQVGLGWNHLYELWGGQQPNWGQVLEFGLNDWPSGVVPPNSFAIDIINKAYTNQREGSANSVSDSFWYAWVHEDGSLVQAINSAPIHIEGVEPSSLGNRAIGSESKNRPGGNAPTLAYTDEQGAQGLTTKVGRDGAIDFRNAGGTGYYRLLVWPESHDPGRMSQDYGAPRLSYEASDLFTSDGSPNPSRTDPGWPVSTVFYNYRLEVPEPPVIEVPAHGSATNVKNQVVISGTGSPGHTITLKFRKGGRITDINDPSLTTLVDGDHAGVIAGDVVVGDDGKWSYTYEPDVALADGEYTVVATQTDQAKEGLNLTSGPSNPDDLESPTSWGVSITVDTTLPKEPTLSCPTAPAENAKPTLTGSGVEGGATVKVYLDGEHVGDAAVSGESWSYTFDPALSRGDHTVEVSQVDPGGNESPLSSSCVLRVTGPVAINGVKLVAPVDQGVPGLTDAAATEWEITATSGAETAVISGDSEFKVTEQKTYTIAERPVRTTPSEWNHSQYEKKGDVECTDGDDGLLGSEVFDPRTGQLTVRPEDDIVEPIRCTITNQTAHVSLWVARAGGQTSRPGQGWGLSGNCEKASAAFELSEQAAGRAALPESYALQASAPDELAVVGIEVLNLADPECAALANNAGDAPQACWIPASETVAGQPVVQGVNNVFRVVAISADELPRLPLTGGLGSWVFTAGGLGAFAAAALGLLGRRLLQERKPPQAEMVVET